MPIYEYECQQCQEVTEISQGINDAPLAECPECGGPVKKLISMSSFHLKGGGWYADGYSSTACGSKNGGCSSSASSPSDSKPASCPKKNDGAPCCAA